MRKLHRAGAIALVCVVACVAAWWAYGPRTWSVPFRKEPTPVLRVTFDGGGRIDEYIKRYSALRLAGGRVVIDGMCISACTLVTGIMPPDRVCVTPFGQLAFHSAWTGGMMGREHSSEDTRLIWNIYPAKLRALLLAKDWNGDDGKKNEHPDLIYVAGDELRSVVRPCHPLELKDGNAAAD